MNAIGVFVPTVDEIRAARKGAPSATLVPVYKELIADLETPVSTFLKIRDGDHSFLLESVEGGERLGRFRCARHPIGTRSAARCTLARGRS